MRWSHPLAAIMILVAACGSDSDPITTAQSVTSTTTDEGGLRILVTPGEPDNTIRDSRAADLGGQLAEVDGCVFIESSGDLLLPWWPRGVTVEGDTIIVPDTHHMDPGQYRIGDHIHAGGGDSDEKRIENSQLDDSTKAWALECLESGTLVSLDDIRNVDAAPPQTPSS